MLEVDNRDRLCGQTAPKKQIAPCCTTDFRFAFGGRFGPVGGSLNDVVASVGSTQPRESYVHVPTTNDPRFHWQSSPFKALLYSTMGFVSVNLRRRARLATPSDGRAPRFLLRTRHGIEEITTLGQLELRIRFAVAGPAPEDAEAASLLRIA